MRLIDAEWITYVLRKIAQAEDKDLSKGEFGQGYVSGVYHAINVIKSTEACLPRVCKHCHLVQYHDNNYCDRCGRLIDEAPTTEVYDDTAVLTETNVFCTECAREKMDGEEK